MSSTDLWYATRASGLMALVLFTLTMVLGITTTTRARARNWPGFAQQEMHRRISMIAVVFLGIHVVTSVLDTYVNISWAAVVIPFTSSYGTFWVGVGAIALDLMIAVFVTSLLRARMRPGTWRAVHWLAYLSWPVALAHTFGMGTDAREGWVIVLGRRVRRLGRRPPWCGGSARSPVRPPRGRRTRRSPACRPSTWPSPHGVERGRVVPSVSEAVPTTGRYRLLGHPTDLAGHVATLGPAPLPFGERPGLARGVRLGARGLRARGSRRGRVPLRHQARRGARRRQGRHHRRQRHGGRAGQRQGQAAPASGLPTSCSTARSCWRRRPVPGGSRCACPTAASRSPSAVSRGHGRARRSRLRAGAARSWSGRPTASSPARSRRSSGWVESGQSLPSFRPDKGTPLRIGRTGALVHNAETLAHVAMIARTGPDALPGPRPRRGPRHLARHHLRRRRAPGRRGGRPRHAADRHRQPGHADRAAPGPPRRRVRRLVGRSGPLHDAVRVAVAACHRGDRGGGHRDRARPGRLRAHGVGAHRPLHGRPERRPVRPVRLRAARHRRRHDPARPRPGRPRPDGAAGAPAP